jgi:hypothetical protein
LKFPITPAYGAKSPRDFSARRFGEKTYGTSTTFQKRALG